MSKVATGQFLFESIPYLQSSYNAEVQSPAFLMKNMTSASFGADAMEKAEKIKRS